MHAVDAEVPRRTVSSEQLGERQHEAAHAGVDVAVGADRGGELGDLGDRVDDALRVLRRRSDDEHGVRTDGGRHRLDVGPSSPRAPASTAIRMPNRCADLWKAAWALSATTICGAVTPRSARPRSRAASTAHWIDSVPPLVRNPAAVVRSVQESGGPPDDLGLDLRRATGTPPCSRAFSCRNSRAACSATSWTDGPPSYTRLNVRPSAQRMSAARLARSVADHVVDRASGHRQLHQRIIARRRRRLVLVSRAAETRNDRGAARTPGRCSAGSIAPPSRPTGSRRPHPPVRPEARIRPGGNDRYGPPSVPVVDPSGPG